MTEIFIFMKKIDISKNDRFINLTSKTNYFVNSQEQSINLNICWKPYLYTGLTEQGCNHTISMRVTRWRVTTSRLVALWSGPPLTPSGSAPMPPSMAEVTPTSDYLHLYKYTFHIIYILTRSYPMFRRRISQFLRCSDVSHFARWYNL